jgi:hypothetical protein
MEFYQHPDYTKLRMEGRFVGEFAEHARTLVGHSEVTMNLVADLSELSFVDATGEEVLLWFRQVGVKFMADSAYSRDVCERLELPMYRELSLAGGGSHPKPKR